MRKGEKQQNLSGDKKRRHKYSLKDFSIGKEDVEQAFATYCAKYKILRSCVNLTLRHAWIFLFKVYTHMHK